MRMKKRYSAAVLAGVLLAGIFGGSTVAFAEKKQETEVYVFIAASLNNAMEEIKEGFSEKYPDIEVLYNADSSGTLQIQIEEGARCDIFFSASGKQVEALREEKFLKYDYFENLLDNKVVLIKPQGVETKVTGFENIAEAESLALAAESVPVGQYAREIFGNLGVAHDVTKMEINECRNVTEVLASVSEGSNEVGVVYATDAASAGDSVEIIAEAPAESLDTPVVYTACFIKGDEETPEEIEAEKAFWLYMTSEEAYEVFEKYGFAKNMEDKFIGLPWEETE